MSLSRAVFPLEIFELILDEMKYQNRHDDLNACALTCKAFLELSRSRLFFDIRLETCVIIVRFHNLVLVNFPDAARYVRRLELDVSGDSQAWHLCSDRAPAVSRILGCLKNIIDFRVVKLFLPEIIAADVSWTLNKLALLDIKINSDMPFLEWISGIPEVTLSLVSFQGPSKGKKFVPHKRDHSRRLRTLKLFPQDLRNIKKLLDGLLSPTFEIETLIWGHDDNLEVSDDEFGLLLKILKNQKDSLKTLRCDIVAQLGRENMTAKFGIPALPLLE